MELDIFRTLWGYQGDWRTAIQELRAKGFDGVEARLPATVEARSNAARLLASEQIPYIPILFTAYDVLPDQNASPDVHLEDFRRKLGWADAFEPRFINVLAGNDRWSLPQQIDFFARALEIARASGHLCCFETHRSRSLYSPWVTLEVARQVPQLLFTTDISHWIVVCERLLDHATDDLSDFISRVHHIQARVGYDQGPQVPHPAAPEYAAALNFHQHHWEQVWASQRTRGYSRTTLTPEFGPDGYLHHVPFSNEPVGELWEINSWMGATERAHFAKFIGSE
ncbi:sugar phosphate isomerase/epimerase [Pseudomonas sp. R3-56]|uniref:sugar phosphate isomerase/epimerase family protein n=1 Tax=Pseudomonas sp. R3-56 TaxID=2817401 RepID=UPI003DA960B8